MDWNQAGNEEQAALKRVVALLLALADLAERAMARSTPVRAFVLWLLLAAEAAARNLVTAAPAPCPFRHTGLSRADAMRLARRLRNLARALDSLAKAALAPGGQGAPHSEVAGNPRRSMWRMRAAGLACLCGRPAPVRVAGTAPGFPDTS